MNPALTWSSLIKVKSLFVGLFCVFFNQRLKEFYLVWSSPVMTGFSLLRNHVWHKPRQEHRLLPAEAGEPVKSVANSAADISTFEVKQAQTHSTRVEGGRRRAGFSDASLESGIFIHFGWWSARENENNSPRSWSRWHANPFSDLW